MQSQNRIEKEHDQYDRLSLEWQTLHQEHERYDRYGLLIKLVATATCLLSILFSPTLWVTLVFVSILWLQEGIWRTVQARTHERLLRLEGLMSNADQQAAMQFYTEWEAQRPDTAGLIKAYLKHAIRPTVAYPYLILIIIATAVFLAM